MQQSQDSAVDSGNADILRAALALYTASDKPNRKEGLKQLALAVPGHDERDYTHAWNQVSMLFEYACKLAFRWANENPPGALIDTNVIEQIFMDEIVSKCRGFQRDDYAQALSYGFERSIF